LDQNSLEFHDQLDRKIVAGNYSVGFLARQVKLHFPELNYQHATKADKMAISHKIVDVMQKHLGRDAQTEVISRDLPFILAMVLLPAKNEVIAHQIGLSGPTKARRDMIRRPHFR
jgi:hypothetical protein